MTNIQSYLFLHLLQNVVLGTDYANYGDIKIEFENSNVRFDQPIDRIWGLNLPAEPRALSLVGEKSSSKPSLPLCCPEGQISEFQHCALASRGQNWRPRLDGASPDVSFEYKGWPKCRNQGNKIAFYQVDVHFNGDEVILPFHVQLEGIKPTGYCITKVSQDEVSGCDAFQTQIYACINENASTPTVVWASITVAHVVVLLTLVVFIFKKEYNSVRREYMICFLASILIYNLSLFPGSSISMNIADVGCVALGATKYFFFCGTFMWFKILCFDVCRSIQIRQRQNCNRRFLLASAIGWIVSAILTTVVLLMPYTSESMSESSRSDQLRETSYEVCKLKMGVDIILQIAQSFSIIIDTILLVVATYFMRGYTRFGNGLDRSDAIACLKLSWKLYFIMVAHVLSSIDANFLTLPVPMWQFVLIESVSIFGVFAYRKSIMQWIRTGACFHRFVDTDPSEIDNLQEKGELTMT